MKIRPKHLEFCMAYLQTNDPGVAYKMTYPKAGIKSLYAAASRLIARPDVSAWIEETRHRMQERLLTEIENTQVQAKKEQVLSIAEKRHVLTGIILGETKRTRHIKTKYGVTKVEDDQPVYALLRAIDLDTRLENFHNYLLHRESFGKNQAPSPLVSPSPLVERAGVRFHINTPTLQQQVNILIAQASGAEIPKVSEKRALLLTKEEYPQGEEVELAEDTTTPEKVPSPWERAEGEASLAPDTSLLPPFKGRIKENSSLEGGAVGGGCPLAPEKVPSPWEGAEGEALASDTTTPEKATKFFPNPNYLTILNKNTSQTHQTPLTLVQPPPENSLPLPRQRFG